MPRKPLLMTAMLMARPSCTMVESSAAVIWKPPSPAMTQTSLSGQAVFAPMAAGRCEAHGAEASGGDEGARGFVLEVLGFPHLVLAYVGDDDGLFEAAGGGGFVPDVVDDVRGVEVAVVGEVDDVADGGGAFAGVDLGEPGGGFGVQSSSASGYRLCSGEQGLEEVQDFFQVADEGYVYLDVFVDFAGVDFYVDLFGVGGVLGEVAGDAVVEAHAEGEQEVGLLDGVVDPGLAVHAHHAELEGVGGGDGAEAEQGAGDGDLVGFGEGDDFFFGAALDDAVAGEDDGALRSFG